MITRSMFKTVLWLITAPSKNTQTLKYKAQPTNAFFATVNQMFGGSSQLPTSAELISLPRARQKSEAGRSHRTFDCR